MIKFIIAAGILLGMARQKPVQPPAVYWEQAQICEETQPYQDGGDIDMGEW